MLLLGKENMRKIINNKIKKYSKNESSYLKNRSLDETIYQNARDILTSENFKVTKKYVQHGTMSVYKHCVNVARLSLILNRKFRLNCQERDLVRGALLHDYFLYDWHDKEHIKIHRLHGFYHPGIALENAGKEYDLTPREKDIIHKHMFPLTAVPPLCREAWIVTIADKYCSFLETTHLIRGKMRD